MTDELENELRTLRLAHPTEKELVAYCDQEADPITSGKIEAHLKQCFICERRLDLLREESAALAGHQITAEDVALVERLMMRVDAELESARDQAEEEATASPWRERLAEYLERMVAEWRVSFQFVPRSGSQGREIWRWKSEDDKIRVRAVMEENTDLALHISTSEIGMAGTRLKVRLGLLNQEATLQRISESEVAAVVVVPWQQRKGDMANLSVKVL